jgi:hypothetical protein
MKYRRVISFCFFHDVVGIKSCRKSDVHMERWMLWHIHIWHIFRNGYLFQKINHMGVKSDFITPLLFFADKENN